jgi:hypothetical protein
MKAVSLGILAVMGAVGGAEADTISYGLDAQVDGGSLATLAQGSGSDGLNSDLQYSALSGTDGWYFTVSGAAKSALVLTASELSVSYGGASSSSTLNVFLTGSGYSSTDSTLVTQALWPFPSGTSPQYIFPYGTVYVPTGLPTGWTLTEALYYSASDASLPANGSLAGFAEIGSLTYSYVNGALEQSGVLPATVSLSTVGGQDFSLVEEISVIANSGNGGVNLGASLTETLSDPPPGVPEASTWAMMAVAFASLGFAGRRAAPRRLAGFVD